MFYIQALYYAFYEWNMNLVSPEETDCLGEFIFPYPPQIHGIFSRIYSPDSSQLEENLALHFTAVFLHMF